LKKLLFATQNLNKLREAAEILQFKYIVEAPPALENGAELPEDYFTLHENACQKATFIGNQCKTDCFAEDTGLEVYALDMQPGVFSARFAGIERDDMENNRKLLRLLAGEQQRGARFRTVIALYEKGHITYFEGILEGRIHTEMSGNGGFGYDSLFIPEGYNQTLAAMESNQKNKISHRKQALSGLVQYLTQPFKN
jgi:XTP/dITP diphosphohydrolase